MVSFLKQGTVRLIKLISRTVSDKPEPIYSTEYSAFMHLPTNTINIQRKVEMNDSNTTFSFAQTKCSETQVPNIKYEILALHGTVLTRQRDLL